MTHSRQEDRTQSRRKILLALGACGLVAPLCALAQQPGKIPRVGFLISETLAAQASRAEALRSGLRELGYIEGKNIAVEIRTADGNYDRLPDLARELVRIKVDVLVAFGIKAASAAKAATTIIPIVVPAMGEFVTLGFAKSHARPGGNITGGSPLSAEEVYTKRLEILKEAVPRMTKVGFLLNPTDTALTQMHLGVLRVAAKVLKIEMSPIEVRSQKEITDAFALMATNRIEGLLIQQDTLFTANNKQIAEMAEKQRIPSAGNREFGEAGALLGYGTSDAGLYRRSAYFVDRILKGTKPADLPIERAMKVELVVNLKTAKALGIKIPQSILARADKVIE